MKRARRCSRLLLYTALGIASGCERSADVALHPPHDAATPAPAVDAGGSGSIIGAQLCCQGDVEAGLGGCLGEGYLVGHVAQANRCVDAGHQLLACAPAAGGWSCLPPKNGHPQLCTCGAPSESLATGVDPHTWSRRAQAVYAAHQAPPEQAVPRSLCCDEVDPQTQSCTWTYHVPSLLSRTREAENANAGPRSKAKAKSAPKLHAEASDPMPVQSGEGTIAATLPPDATIPPRGPIREQDRDSCHATGGQIFECPARATACTTPKRALNAEGTTYSGSCTCEMSRGPER